MIERLYGIIGEVTGNPGTGDMLVIDAVALSEPLSQLLRDHPVEIAISALGTLALTILDSYARPAWQRAISRRLEANTVERYSPPQIDP